MPVEQRLFLQRRKPQCQSACLGFVGEEFLKQNGTFGDLPRRIGFDQCRNFVAEAEKAAWLKSDNGHPLRHERRERGKRSLRFVPRLV